MPHVETYPIGDLRIRVELQDRLSRAARLAGAQIEVRVDHGRVMLEGRVFCERDAREALSAAAEVAGVTEVRHDLRIVG